MPSLAAGVPPSLTVRGLVFGVLYLAAMVSAIALTRLGAQVAPIWIASAVLAWALIIASTDEWPPLIAACAGAHLIGAAFVQDQPLTETVYLAANMISPIVLAGLLRWRGAALDFEHRNEVLRFLGFAGIAAPASSTAIVILAALLAPDQFRLGDCGIWFLADGLSFVVFLPIISALMTGAWRDLFATRVRARVLALLATLIAALLVAFSVPDDACRAILILLLPFTVFIAFDLGATAARVAIGVSAVMLVGNVLVAPTGHDMPPREFIFFAQIYLAAMCASVLPLAAALAEKQRLYETTSQALHDAQNAWGELIAAEAHYRLIADNATDLIMSLAGDRAILFASPACRELSANPENLIGQTLDAFCHPEDRAGLAAEFAGRGVHPGVRRVRLRGSDGAWRPYDLRVTALAPNEGASEAFVTVLRRSAE